MVSIRCAQQSKNYPGYMAAAPQNWDRQTQEKEEVNSTQKTICPPYVKGLSEKIQRICSPYNIRTTFKSLTTLRRYLSWVRTPIVEIVYTIPCSCRRKYRREIGRPLKVRLQEYQKVVTYEEVEKSGMADHIWRENGYYRPLWDQVEIIDKEHHWKIRKLNKSAHMLGHKNLLSWPSIEINTIWEPVMSAREKQY